MPSNPRLDLARVQLSCENCSLAELCLPRGLTGAALDELDRIVLRKRPIERGQHLFRQGDEAGSLFAVRTGSFKTWLGSQDGEEQILGFYLPGELVGLDGLDGRRHHCSAVALETASVCEIPMTELEPLCGKLEPLRHALHELMGREIHRDHKLLLLLARRSAEGRLAGLLLSLSRRFAARGFSPRDFNLSMSRQDIANYLGLAVETVSRLFAHLQEEGLVEVDRRRVVIRDMDRIEALCGGCESGPDQPAQ